MHNVRADFPIFSNHPNLVYLDNTATTQKPAYVIDGIKRYLENDYANIHRGAYSLSERSESLYEASKSAVAKLIGAESAHEIVYCGNSTGAINLLAFSMARSGWLKKGDKVLLSAVEHHANIVPWLMLKEDIGIEVEFFETGKEYDIDFEDLKEKLTPNVKVVATTFVSNVTGAVFDIAWLSKVLDEHRDSRPARRENPEKERFPSDRPLLIVDGSQAVPNFMVDVRSLDIDFMFFTGHKMMADSGIGVLYGKKRLLKSMVPSIGGGGAINFVTREEFEPAGLPFRFEPGTPNMTWAVSLLRAIEYFESIGGYEALARIEWPLIRYTLERFAVLMPKVRLIGPYATAWNRVGVFSFVVEGMHANDVADALAESDICVRAGHHCTEPLHANLSVTSSVRASIYLYTTKEDLDRFFAALEKIVA